MHLKYTIAIKMETKLFFKIVFIFTSWHVFNLFICKPGAITEKFSFMYLQRIFQDETVKRVFTYVNAYMKM